MFAAMRRSLAAATVVVVAAAVVAAATVAPGTGASAPAKTTTPGPGPSAPPTTAAVGPTTTSPTATSAFPATTPPPPGTTTPFPTTPQPPTTVPGTAVPGTFAQPPSTVAPVPFDSTTFFGEFYADLALDPGNAVDLVEASVDLGSAADTFLFHEIAAAIALFRNTTLPLPTYTVTPNGPAIGVCRNDGVCETFADFVVVGGLLTSFTVDGQPIEQRVSVYARETTVEALTVNLVFSVRRPRDEVLSIALVLETAGGGTSFAWEQATYADSTGRQYPIDLTQSQYPARIEADDGNIAHVVFPGAQHGGQLVVPITTDLTGVPTTVRIPIVLNT
jgi:hypothetical protein